MGRNIGRCLEENETQRIYTYPHAHTELVRLNSVEFRSPRLRIITNSTRSFVLAQYITQPMNGTVKDGESALVTRGVGKPCRLFKASDHLDFLFCHFWPSVSLPCPAGWFLFLTSFFWALSMYVSLTKTSWSGDVGSTAQPWIPGLNKKNQLHRRTTNGRAFHSK